MANIDVVDLGQKKVGSVELNDAVFGVPFKGWLITEVVQWQQAKKRRGTQCAMTKAEVSGTTKKPFPQKGRGMARQGSLKNPHQIGGGVAFAPKPRDYGFSMPRAKRRAALATALSGRLKEQRLIVIDEFNLPEAKTKLAYESLKKLGCESALVVDCGNELLKRSMRNLCNSKYIEAHGLNVADVARYPMIVLTKSSLKAIEGKLLGDQIE